MKNNSNAIYLGSHVSMKAPSYLYGSIQEALSYGANAAMIYTGPPSNSIRKDPEMFQIEKSKQLMERSEFDVERLIIHAPYIINLANSIKPDIHDFGCTFLSQELKRAKAIGAKTLVLHPGSHVKAGMEIGIEWIIKGLNQVLDSDDTNVKIALETMAGKGSECGYTFEQLASVFEGVNKKDRIGFCLDTCHVHDAGYNVHDVDGLLAEFDHILSLDRLLCIHINDSKNPKGSHKDRHANIGKGLIGFDALSRIVWHPALRSVTKILETPYIDGKAPYKEEIERLRIG